MKERSKLVVNLYKIGEATYRLQSNLLNSVKYHFARITNKSDSAISVDVRNERRVRFWTSMQRNGIRYRKHLVRNGDKCRKITHRELPHCSEAITITLGVIVELVERTSERYIEDEESINSRMLQSTSFLHGMAVCEHAILQGLYAQGGALVRQELECIASMEESKQGTRKDGKTPDVSNVPYELRKAYSQLSMMTHTSSLPMLQALVATTTDKYSYISLIPRYNNEAARMLLGLHAALLIEFAIQLHILYMDAFNEGLTPNEHDSLELARAFLEEEKLIAPLPSDETVNSHKSNWFHNEIEQAQDALPRFFEMLKDSKFRHHVFFLKVRFFEGEVTEHMWTTNISYKNGNIRGFVSNVPIYVSRPRFGQRVPISRDQITDWKVEHQGTVVEGGFLPLFPSGKTILESVDEENS